MRLTVTTTSEPLLEVAASSEKRQDYGARTYIVRDPTGAEVIYLENDGDGDATTTDGFEWDFATGDLILTVEPGETINARTGSGTAELHVLRLGR